MNIETNNYNKNDTNFTQKTDIINEDKKSMKLSNLLGGNNMSEYNERDNEQRYDGYQNSDIIDTTAEEISSESYGNDFQQTQQNYQDNQSQYRYQYGNRSSNNRTPRKKKGGGAGKFAKLVASGLVFGLVAGVAFQGVNIVSEKIHPKQTYTPTLNTASTIQTSSSGENANYDVSMVAESAMPSIVSITSVVEETINFGWFGSQTQEAEGSGSGIIIAEDEDELYIVTNNHVVEDAKKVTVSFCDKNTVEAEIKGTDSSEDLAVVGVKISDIDKETKEKIKIAVLGNSDDLKVGEPAIAIGNALGYGQSVTSGCISATKREVALTDKTMTLIQTDAAINPGNSGGALLNAKGEVIGINTVKVSDTTIEGMGYAIPITDAQPTIEILMKQQTIPESEQAYLGITGRDITQEYASGFGMPSGIYIVEVQENSPAQEAGLYAGDIITKLDDKELSGMEALISKLAQKKAGDKVTVTVQRQSQGEYKEQAVTVTLGSKKDMPSTTATEQNSYGQNQRRGYQQGQ